MADRPVDLDALAEAFAGVRKLGAPPAKRAVVAPPVRETPPAPAPAVALPARPAPPPPPDDAALLREALRGVRPLSGGAAQAARATVQAARPGPSAIPVATVARELHESTAAKLAAAEREVIALRTADGEARSAIARLEAELAAEKDRARGHEAAARDARAELAALAPAAAVGAPLSLRAAAAARGLLGEDELAAALRALLDARRAGPLFEQLVARNAEFLTTFLADRLALGAEGEAAPPGVVVVRVPAERSELRDDGAVQRALDLFSTACLVHGKRRILFVGGSPGYRRRLREGLDRRLDVRFVEGDQRRLPKVDADLTIVWGSTELDHTVSAHFPGALVVQHRGIIGMLTQAAERLDRV